MSTERYLVRDGRRGPRIAHCKRGHIRNGSTVDKNGYCHECRKENQKRWMENNTERFKELNRKWREENKERSITNRLEYDKLHVEQRRITARKRLYGLEHRDFLRILAAQNHQCAICKREFNESSKSEKVNVDHRHDETNEVRGLLCHQCNIGLGAFRDNTLFLENAIDYLSKTGQLKATNFSSIEGEEHE
jgi:hypothetical protein